MTVPPQDRNWPRRCRRVVFITPRVPEMSGGAVYVENMSEALQARGVEVEHISLLPGTRAPEFLTFVVNPREQLHSGPAFRGVGPRRWLGLPRAAVKPLDRWYLRRRLRARLESYGEESVLVFTHVKAKVVADQSGWRPRADGPLVIGQHHSQFESIDIESWLRPAMAQHYRDLHAMTALSAQDATKFTEFLGIPCTGIGNPYRASTPRPVVREPLAVALSRYSREKQLDLMIRAFAAATARPGLRHWRLELYGEGDLEDELRTAVTECGASDRVAVMGRTDDVPGVLARASLHLLTSSYEGFSLSILEAARAGVPTVAFGCSAGVRELMAGEAGYLVPPGDEEAFTLTLQQALTGDDERLRRGDVALTGTERYSPGAILDRWAALLEDLQQSRA